jgi:nucleotide-binding universal stress UspA family protein
MQTVEAGRRIALNNILFATDFSPHSQAALPYALAVARRYEATLHAAHVMPTKTELVLMSPESGPGVVEAEDNRMQPYIDQLENQLQAVPHSVLTPRGNVANALVQIIEEREIDLLVLGTHGRAGVGKLLIGSVAEEIFRRARCPVLSIGPNVSCKPDSEIQFQRIVFSTDFSENSMAALPYALSLAEDDQAQLALLHVVQGPAAGIADLEDVKASLMLRLKQLVPAEAEPWCHTECLLEFGSQFVSPAERILEFAEERRANLIVLGVRPVRGKLGLATHFASTTAHILTKASCPVLTVRGGRAA